MKGEGSATQTDNDASASKIISIRKPKSRKCKQPAQLSDKSDENTKSETSETSAIDVASNIDESASNYSLIQIDSDKDTNKTVSDSSSTSTNRSGRSISTVSELRAIVNLCAPDIKTNDLDKNRIQEIRTELVKRGILTKTADPRARSTRQPKLLIYKKFIKSKKSWDIPPEPAPEKEKEVTTPEKEKEPESDVYITPQNTPEIEQHTLTIPTLNKMDTQCTETSPTSPNSKKPRVTTDDPNTNNTTIPDHQQPSTSRSSPMDTYTQDDGFKLPKKTVKRSSLNTADRNHPSTSTTNKYSNLSIDDQDPMEATTSATAQHTPKTPKQNRTTNNKSKCPPLVISGKINNHLNFVRELSKKITKGFHIKYTNNNSLLYIYDEAEFKSYKSHLIATHQEFYTYSTKLEKTHAFVLKGLHGQVSTDDIKEQIEDNYGINIRGIYRMKTKVNPMFLIVTDSDITLRNLQQTVTTILFTRITWERRQNQRPLTQCRRCQQFGHATSNCYRSPKCVICAEDHLSNACPKPANDPPKCVNCKQDHTASNPECPVYRTRIEAINNRPPLQPATTERLSLLPAPQPHENVWEKRTRERARQTTASQDPVPQQQQPLEPRTPALGKLRPDGSGIGNTENVERELNLNPDNSDTIYDIARLQRATLKLTNTINLTNTIQAIEHLNKLLETARDDMQAISIVQHFASEILPNYQILKRTAN